MEFKQITGRLKELLEEVQQELTNGLVYEECQELNEFLEWVYENYVNPDME